MSAQSDTKLLLCGMDAKTWHEVYYLVDLYDGIRKVVIENDAAQARTREFLESHLPQEGLPYGYTSHRQLLPYYLHPHSFLQTRDQDVAVFYKQASYFRTINFDRNVSSMYPEEQEIDCDLIFSSTNSLSPDGDSILLSGASGIGRLDIYRKRRRTCWCAIGSVSLTNRRLELGTVLTDFLTDTVHMVGRSRQGFIVAVDMNLTVNTVPNFFSRRNRNGNGAEMFREYVQSPFPTSGFFVQESGETTICTPRTACPAHVEFDLDDPSVFYLSCHNISKLENSVVVHGPASIEKYRYGNKRLEFLGNFSDETFYRITSHKVFKWKGAQYIATTSYPDQLYVLKQDMSLFAKIRLFQGESVPNESPFICDKNSFAPPYLCVSEDGRYIYLAGSSRIFVVDLESLAVVRTTDFCQPGSFLATAHIGLIRNETAG